MPRPPRMNVRALQRFQATVQVSYHIQCGHNRTTSLTRKGCNTTRLWVTCVVLFIFLLGHRFSVFVPATQASSSIMPDSFVRRRPVTEPTTRNSSISSGTGKSNANVDGALERGGSTRTSLLDALRVLTTLVALTLLLSYYLTSGDSWTFNYRPWYTRPGRLGAYIVCCQFPSSTKCHIHICPYPNPHQCHPSSLSPIG